MSNLKIGIAKFQYNGHFGSKELHPGPDAMERGGLYKLLKDLDCDLIETKTAELTEVEENAYGNRYRLGLASRHLADIIAKQINDHLFPIGLLGNCNGLMGMLAGHQMSGPRWNPLRIGLIWIDSHGDFNTPETSLSGMMGGMPVAISTGLCLHHIRRTCGLDPPLPMNYVTMVGVRDTDPGEQYLLDNYNISQISVDDVKRLSPAIDMEIDRLSRLTDLIYVHIDLDALDPIDMPGSLLPVADGFTATELAEALELIFEIPKTKGLGLASYPANRDTEKKGLNSVYTLIEGAIKGIKNRD